MDVLPRISGPGQALLLAALNAVRDELGAAFCGFAPTADAAVTVTGLGGLKPTQAAVRAWAERDRPADASTLVAEIPDPDGGVAGLLVVGFSVHSRSALPGRQEAITPLAAYLGRLLTNYRQHAPAGDGYRALFEIGTQIQAEESHIGGVFELIVDKARELLETDVAWLALVDEQVGRVQMEVARGIRTAAFLEMHVPLGAGVGGVAVEQQRTVVVDDYESFSGDSPPLTRKAVLAEGIVCMICAPMLREGRMIGALYVGNRDATAFADTDAALLSALAAQASVAIDNAQLYARLEEKNTLLEQSFGVHRVLTDAGLEGVGLDGVGRMLARLLDRPVLVDQNIGLPYRARYNPPGAEANDVDEGDTGAMLPIVAGKDRLGRVTVLGGDELSELQRRTVEHGVTVLALELVKLRAAREVEWRLQGELLEELLEARPPVSEALAARARRMGVDVGAPHRIIVFEAAGASEELQYGRLLAAVRAAVAEHWTAWTTGNPVAITRGPRVVLALREGFRPQLDRIIAAVQQATRSASASVVAGVSAPRPDFGAALRDAMACSALARGTDRPEATVRYEDLGALRFLLDAPDLHHAASFVAERLGPLLAHDEHARTPLLQTLRAYLDADGHTATAAERCFVHVSTLKYRIGRINDLFPTPLSDPAMRFELQLALHLHDVLAALGVESAREATPSSG